MNLEGCGETALMRARHRERSETISMPSRSLTDIVSSHQGHIILWQAAKTAEYDTFHPWRDCWRPVGNS